MRGMLASIAKVYVFPFLFSPYLCYSVDRRVGVNSVSGPNSFSLAFPPPTLGSPPVCLQSAVCCKGEAGGSLGSDPVAVGSYCSSKQKVSWRRRDADRACSLEFCTMIFEGKKGE